jgi:hypothetical protein
MNQTLVINGLIINNEEDINDPRVQEFVNQLNNYRKCKRLELPDGVAPQTLQNIIIYTFRLLLLSQTLDNNDIRDVIIEAIGGLYDYRYEYNQVLVINNVAINNKDDINDPLVQEFINILTDYIIHNMPELPNDVIPELSEILIIMCNILVLDREDLDGKGINGFIANTITMAICCFYNDIQEQAVGSLGVEPVQVQAVGSLGVKPVQVQTVRSLGDGSNLPPVDFSFSNVETSESESNDEPNCWCCHCDLL